MARTGRPCAITRDHEPLLIELAQAYPLSTLAELVMQFQERTDLSVHPITLAKALKRAGVVRVKPERINGMPSLVRHAPYGYTEAHRQQRPEQYYPSCLTDAEWARVADLFEQEGGRGKPPRHSRRNLLEACCYVVRSGCSWRMLPRHFPHWDNVYKTFRRWSTQGKFEQMHDRLRAMGRQREAREDPPSAAILDAQSTRISPQGGQSGFDAGKKVKGRKRSLVVDTLGLLLAVSVCAARLQDRDAGQEAWTQAAHKYPGVKTLFVDSAYAGQWARHIEQTHGTKVQVVRHPGNRHVGQWRTPQMTLFPESLPGFVPLPKRWIVERTHAWNERARRLIMHHDRLCSVSVAWVWLAEARMLARRLVN